MEEEPRYEIIVLEVRPHTNVKISSDPEDGIVGIRTVRAVKDSVLRAFFWSEFEKLVERATEE